MDTVEQVNNSDLGKIPWQLKIFMATFLLPVETSFAIGSLRLTACRILLLTAFIPFFLKVYSGKIGKTLLSDYLLLGYVLWIILSLTLNHDLATGLESGGIAAIESLGAYLAARCLIQTKEKFQLFIKLLFIVLVFLAIFTILESFTGINVFRPQANHIGQRFGFDRAFGPFEHPILYGMFCGSLFSLVLYVPTSTITFQRPRFKASVVLAATFASVSSGALACAVVQIILTIWDKITTTIANRWRLFTILIVFCYFVVDLLSNRTPIRVFLHRLTFSADTAYNRLIIWEWGTKHNVAHHPWIGIGKGDWVKPGWMHSSSMDNFWLVNMVRYGLPSFALLALAILSLFYLANRNSETDDETAKIKRGWIFSLIGLIIAGCTVHFWNSLYIWFFFLLGSGGWIAYYSKEQNN